MNYIDYKIVDFFKYYIGNWSKFLGLKLEKQ